MKTSLSTLALIGFTLITTGCAALMPPVETVNLDPINVKMDANEARLRQLEAQVNGPDELDLINQMTFQEDELRVINGKLQEQFNDIKRLQKQQRTLYLDLDKRLTDLESGKSTETSATSAPSDQDNEDARAYEIAIQLLKQRQYDQAITAMRQFLEQYPDSNFAPNAAYWLGESFYVSRRFEPALEAFRSVVKDYPKHQKALDAQLKIGMTLNEMGEYNSARISLQKIIEQHPDGDQAKRARDILDTLPE